MRAGGNAAMIDWWSVNGVDPRSSIPTKYAHPATQAYREKIKANVAGKEYVPAPVSKGSSTSSLSRSGPAYGNASSSPALSKSTGSSSSSTSSLSSASSGTRKPKKKSSSSSKKPATQGTATGVLFSFGDDEPSPAASAGSVSDDSDEEAFESFVSAKPKPQSVPDYSDARLRQYEGATSFGSDDLDGTKKAAAPPQTSTDDIFSALSTGWTKFAQVANTTKDRLVESTAGLKQKVEQSQISERATSFMQSLWSGMDPGSDQPQEQSQASQSQAGQQQPPQQSRSTRPIDGEGDVDAWLDRSGPKGAEADDGWGAWDGGKDDEDVTAPASAKSKGGKDDDSWGAWSSAPPASSSKKKEKEKAKQQPTVVTPVAPKKATEPALVNLDFAAAPASVAPPQAASKDGWDDWAFTIK
jgi:hypothetical protein